MTASDFTIQLAVLTDKIYTALRQHIADSRYISKHNNLKAIKVNVFDYVELTIVHDKLTFLDTYGNEHSIDSDCTLEDLIDILQLIELDDVITKSYDGKYKSEYKD